MRLLHYSKRNETAYVDSIKRYILIHNRWHPREMAEIEVVMFSIAPSCRNRSSKKTASLGPEVDIPSLDQPPFLLHRQSVSRDGDFEGGPWDFFSLP